MGTITPNSTIHFLKGIPLDNTYNNTVLFTSAEAQLNAFIGDQQAPWYSTKQIIQNQMYQRVSSGVLRVNLNYGKLYDYNYMVFKNAGISTVQEESVDYTEKWFYAFINSVEYVNERASNVYYEIDVIQTWLFDAVLLDSFVVREHPLSDNIGEHIETENVDLGRIICDDEISDQQLDIFDHLCACVAYAMPTPIESGD